MENLNNARNIYFNSKETTILLKSLPFITVLEPLFYDSNRNKRIPRAIIDQCTLPIFLAVLYTDDGSLSISYRVNHRLKKVYLTPHIYLYLQCFSKECLEYLATHLNKFFNVELKLSRRKDGRGYVLKTTSVNHTYKLLDAISIVAINCPSMFYKTIWEYRLIQEKEKWKTRYIKTTK